MGLPLPLLLALYALCYAPFSALTKVVGQPIAALPASLLGSCLAWGAYLVLCGDAGRRPRFDAQAIAAGVGGAAILCASTVSYGLGGSLVLPLLLMKGGGLAVAPLSDAAAGARVSRRSALVLFAVGAAVLAGAWHRVRVDGTAATLCCAVVYLCGYGAKLRAVGQRRGDRDFFLAETTATLAIAMPVSLAACLLSGTAPLLPVGVVGELRAAASPDPFILALVAGAFSQGVGVFGSMILLQREAPGHRAATHSALLPLHRASSLLAGMAASAFLGLKNGGWAMTGGEILGGAVLVVALAFGASAPRRPDSSASA